MFKRILVVFGIAALAIGSTWAYFSAEAVSDSNVVTAGTLTFGSPVNAQFNIANAAPGQNFPGNPDNYDVGNKGTIDANHIEIAVANAITDAGNNADPDMDQMLTIGRMTYGSLDLKSIIEGNSGLTSVSSGGYLVSVEGGATFGTLLAGGVMNLDSWEGKVIEIADDPGPGGIPIGLKAGDTVLYDLDLTFNSLAGNVYQGDSVNSTVTFTLNQDVSQ